MRLFDVVKLRKAWLKLKVNNNWNIRIKMFSRHFLAIKMLILKPQLISTSFSLSKEEQCLSCN
jgi:hypothetical protein